MRRRAILFSAAALLLGLILPAGAAEFLEDSRTARGVSLTSPRASLGECVRLLSQASGVPLSVAEPLAQEPLTGHVPRRPLRETMDALADLYDGVWTAVPGMSPGHRLSPDPVKAKKREAERAAFLAGVRKAIDGQAATLQQELKDLRTFTNTSRQAETLALLLWPHLSAADRDRALRGATVTVSIPEAKAGVINDLMVLISSKENEKLTQPLLATFDLDDPDDRGLPSLRARATGMRENSLVAAIGRIDLSRFILADKGAAAEPSSDSPLLPEDLPDGGRVGGERDALVVKVGQMAGLPILSRHRVYGGSSPGVSIAGRRVSQVTAELAAACEAVAEPTARGFILLRSRSAFLDPGGYPPEKVVREYLRTRPAAGEKVRLAQLEKLAPLSPMQLSVLARSNLASEEARFAGETFALLRFFHALMPPQREALLGETGLDVASLKHEQLHALLDQRIKRGDWDVYPQLQQIRGLRFRFRELPERPEESLVLEALRDGEVVSVSALTLPVVEEEEAAVAGRN